MGSNLYRYYNLNRTSLFLGKYLNLKLLHKQNTWIISISVEIIEYNSFPKKCINKGGKIIACWLQLGPIIDAIEGLIPGRVNLYATDSGM